MHFVNSTRLPRVSDFLNCHEVWRFVDLGIKIRETRRKVSIFFQENYAKVNSWRYVTWTVMTAWWSDTLTVINEDATVSDCDGLEQCWLKWKWTVTSPKWPEMTFFIRLSRIYEITLKANLQKARFFFLVLAEAKLDIHAYTAIIQPYWWFLNLPKYSLSLAIIHFLVN